MSQFTILDVDLCVFVDSIVEEILVLRKQLLFTAIDEFKFFDHTSAFDPLFSGPVVSMDNLIMGFPNCIPLCPDFTNH